MPNNYTFFEKYFVINLFCNYLMLTFACNN